MIPEELLVRLLETWPVGRLATSGHSGPHIVPIVFCLDGDALFSPIDGKAKSSKTLQRLTNVATNPRFSLLLDRYSEDWQQLWWVRLDGDAQIYLPDKADLSRLVALLQSKYSQYQQTPVTRGQPTFLRLQWDTVSSWSQQAFTRDSIHRPKETR